ncbi:DUF4325 domain-containing protein [Ferrovibrio sp.]|uniref:STAS-like domain-containing protein n=1 Tax=Ferrovibrio sp. TaxID=1917215 RepID=UPI0025BACFAA|nr:DUF4325 domain-containing protein [Ferrovibrio sp.]MBX3455381.1 DUF4325 domain-containing protein [Ferrovibrio sp.]
MRQACVQIKNLIEFRGYETINLDFSKTQVAFSDVLVPFSIVLQKYIDECVKFKVVLPRYDKFRRLLLNTDFLHHIDPRRYPKSSIEEKFHLPIKRFTDPNAQDALVNSIIDNILRVIYFLDRSHLRALEWSLNEIMDNVLTHSESSLGGMVQLSIHSVSKEIAFCVADAGIGIPVSLSGGLQRHLSHVEALEESIKEGVTRGTGQGNGLFGSSQIAAISGGAFSINSGKAFLNYDRKDKAIARPDDSEYFGTSISCAINYSKPLILEHALKFKDGPHLPMDLIDMKYDGMDGVLNFLLSAEAPSISNRPAGFSTRKKLEYLISQITPKRIFLDFKDIGMMSSSFADELISKTVEKIGINEFNDKYIIGNISEINIKIIYRSIRQRLNVDEVILRHAYTD